MHKNDFRAFKRNFKHSQLKHKLNQMGGGLPGTIWGDEGEWASESPTGDPSPVPLATSQM